MTGTAEEFSTQLAEIGALTQATNTAIETLLTLTREVDCADRDAAEMVLEFAQLIGCDGQVREGQLTRALAEAHRVKANRGGLVPWISTHLDVTPGAARGIAQSARDIGHLPELAEPLASGRIGTTTIRALTRTARAVKGTEQDLSAALTETLELSARDGVTQANRHVRILEEKVDPGSAERLLARQRARSFLRVLECEDGMCRIEALLDPERAAILRAAIDVLVSAWLRERQYDGIDPLSEDISSIEQLQAQALTRFAEVFLAATPEQRGATFTTPVVFSAPLNPAEDAGLAESFSGTMLPRTVMAPVGNPASHLLEHEDSGQPVRLDKKPLDQNPAARLASPAQRIAIAWRDRTCTHPGCTRPSTWALNIHHLTPYSENGPTIMQNLTSLCSEHHALAHHPGL